MMSDDELIKSADELYGKSKGYKDNDTQEALKLYLQVNDDNITHKICGKIVAIYCETKKYEEALKWIKKFLEFNIDSNDYREYKNKIDDYISKIDWVAHEQYNAPGSYGTKAAAKARELYKLLANVQQDPKDRGQTYARTAILCYENKLFDDAYLWSKKYFADEEVVNCKVLDEEHNYKERLNKYITAINISKVERKFLHNSPDDDVLKGKIVDALKNSGTVDITGTSFKYFSRSMIQALMSILTEKKEEVANLCKEAKPRTKLSFLKPIIFKIGNIDCNYKTGAYINHFINGLLENTGKYKDIYPFLALMTDCEENKNSNLAKEFLNFRNSAFEFTENHLSQINSKFNDFSDTKLKKYYAEKLTLYAFLITYIEPIRYYLTVCFDDENSSLSFLPIEYVYASHIATTLKMIRDKEKSLQTIFDPSWVPTSGGGVKNTNTVVRKQAIDNSVSFFNEKNGDKKEIRKHVFEYDSSEENELSDYGSDDEAYYWKVTYPIG